MIFRLFFPVCSIFCHEGCGTNCFLSFMLGLFGWIPASVYAAFLWKPAGQRSPGGALMDDIVVQQRRQQQQQQSQQQSQVPAALDTLDAQQFMKQRLLPEPQQQQQQQQQQLMPAPAPAAPQPVL
jgi:uncharacterized membrane protein YqaE (UPF0057 family)